MCMIIINVTPVTIYYIVIILCHVGFWFVFNKYLYTYIHARYELLIHLNGRDVIYIIFKRQYYNKLQKFSSTTRPANIVT